MNHLSASLLDGPGPDKFVYLPAANILLNLGMISLMRFGGEPEAPHCQLFVGCHNMPIEIKGVDLASLLEYLRLDIHAVQTALQHAKLTNGVSG